MKTSILKPNMTLPTVASPWTPRKRLGVPAPLPPRQPLPRALIDRSKPMLKLGLDVHLEFIMAVVQRGQPTLSSLFPDEHLPAWKEKGKSLLEKGNADEQPAGEL